MSDEPGIHFLRDRQGHSVAYAVHGEGPLVICPVWWVSHVEKDWGHEPFRLFYERLGRGMRVVRYDRPGVGLSDRDVPSRTLADEVALLDDLARELGNPLEEANALYNVSYAPSLGGDTERAIAQLEEARDIYLMHPDSVGLSDVLSSLAVMLSLIHI